MPPIRRGFKDGLPKETICLPKVRCGRRSGSTGSTSMPTPNPLRILKDMIPIMDHYEFGNLTLMQDQTVSINCNWKAVLDNFSELYHVHYLHPQHRFVDCTESLSECYRQATPGSGCPAPPPTRCSLPRPTHGLADHAA